MGVNMTPGNVSFDKPHGVEEIVNLEETPLDFDLENSLEEPFIESKTGDLKLHSSHIKHNLLHRPIENPLQFAAPESTAPALLNNPQLAKDVETSVLNIKIAVSESPETANQVLTVEIEQLNLKHEDHGGNALINKLIKDYPKELAKTLSLPTVEESGNTENAEKGETQTFQTKQLLGGEPRLSSSSPKSAQDVLATALKNSFESSEQPQKTIFAKEIGKALVLGASPQNQLPPLVKIIEKSQSRELLVAILGNLSDRDVAVLKSNPQLTTKLVDISQKFFDQTLANDSTPEKLKAITNLIKINSRAINSSELFKIIYQTIKGGELNVAKQTALVDVITAWITTLDSQDPNLAQTFKLLLNDLSQAFAENKTSQAFAEINNQQSDRETEHLNNRNTGLVVGTMAAVIGKAIRALNSDREALRDFHAVLQTAVEASAGSLAASSSKLSEAAVAANAVSQFLPFINNELSKGNDVSQSALCAWKSEIKNEWTQNYVQYGWTEAQAYFAAKILDNVWEVNALGKC